MSKTARRVMIFLWTNF
uniref:Uncharacterized protein n=1 Tax=Rhizophora mucronata TaxID=61149 RepID=A0A2P2Q9P8_RHIMU